MKKNIRSLGAQVGGQALDPEALEAGLLQDYFSPGQFEKLMDDQKLTRPSFEQMVSGVRFAVGRGLVTCGSGVGPAPATYKTLIIPDDPGVEPVEGGDFEPSLEHLLAKASQYALEHHPLLATGASKYLGAAEAAPLATFAEQEFLVVSTSNLEPAPGAAPTSAGASYHALAEQVAGYQVVPLHEAVFAS